jgi:hypothetical protein
LDVADCNIIGGWAYDSDASSSQIAVHLYDGGAGVGTLIGGYETTGLRSDVNTALGISGNHGYTISTPNSLKDGKSHLIYAYAIDTAGGSNTDLSGSPKTLQCAASQPPTAGPITMPPPDTITSQDGNVTVGVSSRYGGAIVYYKDKRIPDSTVANGNIIDYSNGGSLLSTAIWTLPVNLQEREYCYDDQKINGFCNVTQPFNNPTQGGYSGDGWAGNPNQTTVQIENNSINVSYRAVNFNYGYYPVKPLLESNRHEWQTDIWGDIKIYFHPILKDVVVVETKITYCKDMNENCRSKVITAQDTQLSTLYAAGISHPDSRFWGPYTRPVYPKGSDGTIQGLDGVILDGFENWAAILQTSIDVGIGMSIPLIGKSSSFHALGVPVLAVTSPSLWSFEELYGVSNFEAYGTENSRLSFQPNG